MHFVLQPFGFAGVITGIDFVNPHFYRRLDVSALRSIPRRSSTGASLSPKIAGGIF
jgi:hypothetical protein